MAGQHTEKSPTAEGTNMLYNKRTKSVKHFLDEKHIFEAQRSTIIPLWHIANDITYDDVENRQEVETKTCKLGSKIVYHKLDHTMAPSNPEFPNHFYWATIKLSFADIFDPAVSGVVTHHADNATTACDSIENTSFINIKNKHGADWNPHLDNLTNQEQTGGIRAIMKDDYFKHFVRLSKKQTVYDDNYLFSTRKMRVPGKVARINPGTFYGLYCFNDNPRPDADADTVNVLHYDLKYDFTESVIA